MASGYSQPQAVTGQTGHPQVQYIPRPLGIPGVPPGLEYLSQVDQLQIHQLPRAFMEFKTENKYQIKNTLGQQIYSAAEESPFSQRMFCGPSRGFVIHITDNLGQEVIRVSREFKFCDVKLQVEAPVGQVVGNVRQLQSFLQPGYSVMDAHMSKVFYVEGPTFVRQDFRIYTADRAQQVGKLSKQWSGVVREMFTDANNFSASFPMDLDVRMKATLLGTVFLINMHFEQKKHNRD